MSEMFHAPAGALRSNLGLLAGTVIQELRMRPYIDRELGNGEWSYHPEYREFTVVSVQREAYRCCCTGESELFWWPAWTEQQKNGFLEDGCTLVNYYVKTAPPPPPPYPEGKPDFSPYGLRCAEIDEAALLLQDPDAFAETATEPDLSPMASDVSRDKPPKKFYERGGCPFYRGELLGGSRSTVLCDAVRPQLHGYVGLKFCEEGRKAYCPIWRARNGR